MEETYEIKFIDYNGELIDKKVLKYNDKIKEKKPKRYFYKFICWSPKLEKKATHNCVYQATYKPLKDKNKNGISDEEEFQQIIDKIITNDEYLKRKDFKHHGDKSVYDHSYEVAYYAYKMSKKLGLDYRSTTIAAMLHDFYFKDWQKEAKTGEKTPLFKQHGFVHAHQALENSKTNFPDLMNKKVENAINRHMFPLNITPPKYLEAWIVSLSDKYASRDVMKDYKILLSFFSKKYRK